MFELANEGAGVPDTLADLICYQRQFEKCTCIAVCSSAHASAVEDGTMLFVSETAGTDSL